MSQSHMSNFQFHWGYKIGLAYTVFVGLMLFMVYMAVKQDFFLVTDQFYEEAQAYEQVLDKQRNVSALSAPVTAAWFTEGDYPGVQLTFPQEMIGASLVGNIHFYRPSDGRSDFEVPVDLNAEGIQIIESEKLIRGLWKIKISWSKGGEEFYQELDLVM